MHASIIVFLAIFIVGSQALPSRVRRQFNWGAFESSNSNDWDNQNFIRVPRQRGWGNNQPQGWTPEDGRQFGFDQFGNNINQNLNNGVTNAPDVSTTTRAPAVYMNCMNSCLFTKQYNPVCGSDGNTYSNEHELNCARRCGRNVVFARGGTCQPL